MKRISMRGSDHQDDDVDARTLLALAAARSLYVVGLSQKEIAKEMGISPATVSRLLSFALKTGLVQVKISPPLNILCAEKLQTKMPANVRVIVTTQGAEAVGDAAARYLEQSTKGNFTIVLDGGLTVGGFVNSLVPGVFENVTIAPVCADPASYEVSAYELMTRLATKFGKTKCIKPPHFRGRMLDSVHRDIQREVVKADYVFLGAGPWRPGFTALEFVRHLNLDSRDLMTRYPNVIGLCGYLALDSEGGYVEVPEITEKMPRALGFAELRRLAASRASVVLLAASEEKVDIVLSVVKASICNTVIVDQELAAKALRILS